MKIEDHADRAGGPPVARVGELPGRGRRRILSNELVAADDLSDEDEFPEFGMFLQVSPDPDAALGNDIDREFWECPGSLSSEIVAALEDRESAESPTDLEIEVRRAWKGEDGWEIEADFALTG